jgi:hypothetical protein
MSGTEAQSPEQQAGAPPRPTDWWHREHPTFTSLTGFFAGMLAVTLVPGAFAGILRLLFTYDKAEQLFPWIAVLLVIPIGLVLYRPTRRFGRYLWIGMILTALVVLGVASLVLYFMVRYHG